MTKLIRLVSIVLLSVFASSACASGMFYPASRPRFPYESPVSYVVDQNLRLTCVGPGMTWIPHLGCLRLYNGYWGFPSYDGKYFQNRYKDDNGPQVELTQPEIINLGLGAGLLTFGVTDSIRAAAVVAGGWIIGANVYNKVKVKEPKPEQGPKRVSSSTDCRQFTCAPDVPQGRGPQEIQPPAAQPVSSVPPEPPSPPQLSPPAAAAPQIIQRAELYTQSTPPLPTKVDTSRDVELSAHPIPQGQGMTTADSSGKVKKLFRNSLEHVSVRFYVGSDPKPVVTMSPATEVVLGVLNEPVWAEGYMLYTGPRAPTGTRRWVPIPFERGLYELPNHSGYEVIDPRMR